MKHNVFFWKYIHNYVMHQLAFFIKPNVTGSSWVPLERALLKQRPLYRVIF